MPYLPVKRTTPLRSKTRIRRFTPLRGRSKAPHKISRRQRWFEVKRAYLALHPVCAVPDCGRASFDIHHRRGNAGPLLFDERYFLPTCRKHHTWFHGNVAQSVELGFSDRERSAD